MREDGWNRFGSDRYIPNVWEELSSIRQLIQDCFLEGKRQFMVLIVGLGTQKDPKRRCNVEEMREIARVGIEILQFRELSSEEVRSLLKTC